MMSSHAPIPDLCRQHDTCGVHLLNSETQSITRTGRACVSRRASFLPAKEVGMWAETGEGCAREEEVLEPQKQHFAVHCAGWSTGVVSIRIYRRCTYVG